jgi:regulator of sigma E protease
MVTVGAILSIGLLILMHETGHLLVARALRLRVEVFSLGFGPTLLSFQGKQTEYRLALIPLGGYVRIGGMIQANQCYAKEEQFVFRPAWQRLVFLGAGPLANWLFAVIMLAFLYSHGFQVSTGEPVVEQAQGPAAAAGLIPGDRILAVQSSKIFGWNDFLQELATKPQNEVALKILRRQTELTLILTLDKTRQTGITPQRRLEKYPLGESLMVAAKKTIQITAMMADDLRKWTLGSNEIHLIGPAGVVSATAKAAQKNFFSMFLILIQISLALAIMNILPLPSLDGGRIAFVLIELIIRRPAGQRLESIIHAIGLLIIFALMIFLSLREIYDIWARYQQKL